VVEKRGSAVNEPVIPKKKRKSGIPTGNAGEYLVMGELLRRGYQAQLADRNTQGYDLAAGRASDLVLRKIQVKTVRMQPWFIRVSDFIGTHLNQPTIYVLLGPETANVPVRFFITKNRDLAGRFHHPPDWKAQEKDSGFMKLEAVKPYEGAWDHIFEQDSN
jgi:hypothetical protein